MKMDLLLYFASARLISDALVHLHDVDSILNIIWLLVANHRHFARENTHRAINDTEVLD